MYVTESSKYQEDHDPLDISLNNQSMSDETVDYSDIIRSEAFLGEYPFSVILEGIRDQFEDYMNTEDITNYVDIFYDQLNNSYIEVKNDKSEEYSDEIIEALDNIHYEFINFMNDIINSRLTISIACIENEEYDYEELEIVFRKVYEFFILNAKKNFKNIITKDVVTKMENIIEDDDEYMYAINEYMKSYTPLIVGIKPVDFLKYSGDEEICELFDDGIINGNFLRKYTPKLYQNEEFEVDIIDNIIITQHFRNSISDFNKGGI